MRELVLLLSLALLVNSGVQAADLANHCKMGRSILVNDDRSSSSYRLVIANRNHRIYSEYSSGSSPVSRWDTCYRIRFQTNAGRVFLSESSLAQMWVDYYSDNVDLRTTDQFYTSSTDSNRLAENSGFEITNPTTTQHLIADSTGTDRLIMLKRSGAWRRVCLRDLNNNHYGTAESDDSGIKFSKESKKAGGFVNTPWTYDTIGAPSLSMDQVSGKKPY